MLVPLSTQTVEQPDGEPERLRVTRLARDAVSRITRLRGLRRRRAAGDLDEEAYRREAAQLSADPQEPARDPDAAS
jgi:hypothetical protein